MAMEAPSTRHFDLFDGRDRTQDIDAAAQGGFPARCEWDWIGELLRSNRDFLRATPTELGKLFLRVDSLLTLIQAISAFQPVEGP